MITNSFFLKYLCRFLADGMMGEICGSFSQFILFRWSLATWLQYEDNEPETLFRETEKNITKIKMPHILEKSKQGHILFY